MDLKEISLMSAFRTLLLELAIAAKIRIPPLVSDGRVRFGLGTAIAPRETNGSKVRFAVIDARCG